MEWNDLAYAYVVAVSSPKGVPYDSPARPWQVYSERSGFGPHSEGYSLDFPYVQLAGSRCRVRVSGSRTRDQAIRSRRCPLLFRRRQRWHP